jgi:hypothetical protein
MIETTLNENEKKKIGEEEKFRAEAREKAKKELENKKQNRSCLSCLGVILLLALLVIVSSAFGEGVKKEQSAEVKPTNQEQQEGVEETEKEQKKKAEEEAARRAAEEEVKREAAEEAEKNLQGYIDLINTIGMNAYVNSVGYYSGFKWIEVTVKNTWHYEPKQIRLQAAQTLWNVWATQFCPEKETIDNCRIRIVDLAGNEVGGSSAWAGSMVNVKD